MKESLKALLAPRSSSYELAEGLSVQIRELSLKERILWRAESVKEDGSLKDDWVSHLLYLSVRDMDGDRIWESAAEVDGSESVLGRLLEAVQRINGLAADSNKEAQGN